MLEQSTRGKPYENIRCLDDIKYILKYIVREGAGASHSHRL